MPYPIDKPYRIIQFGVRGDRSAHQLRVMDRAGTFPAK